MVKIIRLKTKTSNYLIRIGNGSFKKIINDLKRQQSNKYILIDSKVYNNFSSYFNKLKRKDIILIKINSSEKIKSIKHYWDIASQLLNKKINRSSIIVAIGGGTLGDLVGFIASTILRGVKFILIPTTLLSQVDSSIGGKNGINSKFAKNVIGTFYQPSTGDRSYYIDAVYHCNNSIISISWGCRNSQCRSCDDFYCNPGCGLSGCRCSCYYRDYAGS